MRQTIAFLILLAGLSGCFAQRMELDDPLGLPLNQPQLGVQVQSAQSSQLALQFQKELVQLLPRERHVLARALDAKAKADWVLKAELQVHRESLRLPVPLLDDLNAVPQVRVEVRLTATLTPPSDQTAGSGTELHWDFVQRGDARPAAEKQLTQELLRALRDRLLLAMQPRYRYQ